MEAYGHFRYHHRLGEEYTANSARELWDWARNLEEEELELGAAHLLSMHSGLRKMKDSSIEAALTEEQVGYCVPVAAMEGCSGGRGRNGS